MAKVSAKETEYNKLTYYLLTFDDEIVIADTFEKDEC